MESHYVTAGGDEYWIHCVHAIVRVCVCFKEMVLIFSRRKKEKEKKKPHARQNRGLRFDVDFIKENKLELTHTHTDTHSCSHTHPDTLIQTAPDFFFFFHSSKFLNDSCFSSAASERLQEAVMLWRTDRAVVWTLLHKHGDRISDRHPFNQDALLNRCG